MHENRIYTVGGFKRVLAVSSKTIDIPVRLDLGVMSLEKLEEK